MSAILFGSISTVIDTSELQREAFNQAFAQHGLDWSWDREEYLGLLESNGGKDRIAAYADDRGEDVDAAAVHDTKSTIFRENLGSAGLEARPGVVETIKAAHGRGLKIGLVTTTSPDNVTALIEALGPDVTAADFDVVVDATSVEAGKPDPAAYTFALAELGEDAADCVAVEDNLGGIGSATAAGVEVVAFPNENTAGHDFGATRRVVAIDVDDLTGSTNPV